MWRITLQQPNRELIKNALRLMSCPLLPACFLRLVLKNILSFIMFFIFRINIVADWEVALWSREFFHPYTMNCHCLKGIYNLVFESRVQGYCIPVRVKVHRTLTKNSSAEIATRNNLRIWFIRIVTNKAHWTHLLPKPDEFISI